MIHQAFDFTPADQLTNRQADRFYQLGDLTFRLRTNNEDAWVNYSTAAARQSVSALAAVAPALASADLSPTLPDTCPLQIIRTWTLENGRLVLQFDVKNKSTAPVEIGALGLPLIFNNNTGYEGDKGTVQALSAFSDPAIGLEGGYVQVTRLNGHGLALVVVPEGKTPLEGYEPLQSDKIGDLTPTTQTFEAFYEWMVHSAAYAYNEWKTEGARWVRSHGPGGNYANADGQTGEPWNIPTSEILAPGASRAFGLKFLLSPEIRDIDQTLAANDRPVAIGIPGYILPMGMEAQLFLKYPKKVKSIVSEPAGAIEVKKNKPAKDGWANYTLDGKGWGRSNLRIEYSDGLLPDHGAAEVAAEENQFNTLSASAGDAMNNAEHAGRPGYSGAPSINSLVALVQKLTAFLVAHPALQPGARDDMQSEIDALKQDIAHLTTRAANAR